MEKERDKDHALDEENLKGSGAKLMFRANGEFRLCEPHHDQRVASQQWIVDAASRGNAWGGIPPCRESRTPVIQRTVDTSISSNSRGDARWTAGTSVNPNPQGDARWIADTSITSNSRGNARRTVGKRLPHMPRGDARCEVNRRRLPRPKETKRELADALGAARG